MRYHDGFNILKVESISDLEHDEYMCTNCNKVISKEEVVTENHTYNITRNGINYCSPLCKKENQKGYDRHIAARDMFNLT